MAAYPAYRINLKSEEQLAASQLNTIFVGLSSTADLLTFCQNVENIFQANVVTANALQASDYTLPYPAGTGTVWRLVLRDASGHVDTQYLYDISATAVPQTVAADLIAAGVLLYPYGTACTSIQISVFQPGEYVGSV